MSVTFKDFSFQVKAQLNSISLQWLKETASEIAAQANRNVKLEDDAGLKLRGSYSYVVDSIAGKATIGTPYEEGFWEEFGTGSYADTDKNGGREGRKDWWVYIRNNPNPRPDTAHYRTKEEAEAIASRMRSEGFDAVATNGRRPSYTLENSFKAVKPGAIAELENRMKGGGAV